MSTVITASEVHKQYNEMLAAFRKLIPDPSLRMAFGSQIDGYMRQYVLGVWQADSASSSRASRSLSAEKQNRPAQS